MMSVARSSKWHKAVFSNRWKSDTQPHMLILCFPLDHRGLRLEGLSHTCVPCHWLSCGNSSLGKLEKMKNTRCVLIQQLYYYSGRRVNWKTFMKYMFSTWQVFSCCGSGFLSCCVICVTLRPLGKKAASRASRAVNPDATDSSASLRLMLDNTHALQLLSAFSFSIHFSTFSVNRNKKNYAKETSDGSV